MGRFGASTRGIGATQVGLVGTSVPYYVPKTGTADAVAAVGPLGDARSTYASRRHRTHRLVSASAPRMLRRAFRACAGAPDLDLRRSERPEGPVSFDQDHRRSYCGLQDTGQSIQAHCNGGV